MLKIVIVGCGKIADSHAAQIKRIRYCELVAVCDREQLLAQQLAERFGLTVILSIVPPCWIRVSLMLYTSQHPRRVTSNWQSNV